MNSDKFDHEMRALLSAYAMGTLTEAERERLFAKALGDQGLFDSLMNEEATRATLESPHAKRALADALEKLEKMEERPRPRVNRWLWVAVACSVAVGAFSLAWLRPAAVPEKPTEVAVMTRQVTPKPLAAVAPAVPPKAGMVAKAAARGLGGRADEPTAPASALNARLTPPITPPLVAPAPRQEAKKLEAMETRQADSLRDAGANAFAAGIA